MNSVQHELQQEIGEAIMQFEKGQLVRIVNLKNGTSTFNESPTNKVGNVGVVEKTSAGWIQVSFGGTRGNSYHPYNLKILVEDNV